MSGLGEYTETYRQDVCFDMCASASVRWLVHTTLLLSALPMVRMVCGCLAHPKNVLGSSRTSHRLMIANVLGGDEQAKTS